MTEVTEYFTKNEHGGHIVPTCTGADATKIRSHEALRRRRPVEILRGPSLHPIHKNQTRELVPKA